MVNVNEISVGDRVRANKYSTYEGAEGVIEGIYDEYAIRVRFDEPHSNVTHKDFGYFEIDEIKKT